MQINPNHQIQRKQIRLQGYDYSQSGWYFITICIQDRIELLGQIVGVDPRVDPDPNPRVDPRMVFNDIGKMINRWLHKIPHKFKNIQLDISQIMPNHIHTIIHIVGADPRVRPIMDPRVRPSIIGSTHGSTPTGNPTGDPTVGEIIQWFKTITTNEYIRNVKNNHWPKFNKRIWQRNYFEHIIRNESELFRIRKYIIDNPKNWLTDRNNPNYSNLNSHLLI